MNRIILDYFFRSILQLLYNYSNYEAQALCHTMHGNNPDRSQGFYTAFYDFAHIFSKIINKQVLCSTCFCIFRKWSDRSIIAWWLHQICQAHEAWVLCCIVYTRYIHYWVQARSLYQSTLTVPQIAQDFEVANPFQRHGFCIFGFNRRTLS